MVDTQLVDKIVDTISVLRRSIVGILCEKKESDDDDADTRSGDVDPKDPTPAQAMHERYDTLPSSSRVDWPEQACSSNACIAGGTSAYDYDDTTLLEPTRVHETTVTLVSTRFGCAQLSNQELPGENAVL